MPQHASQPDLYTDLWPTLSPFLRLVFHLDNSGIPLHEYSHQQLYRSVYLLTFLGFRSKLYQDFISVATDGLTHSENRLNTINDVVIWFRQFSKLIQDHEATVRVVTAVFAFLERTYMKPSLNQDFHGLLVEMFRKLVVKPSENKITYILKLVEKNQVNLRQEEVQPVLEGLWKLWSEYFWLNPWLFEKHVPDAAIKAKNHQQKATRERRTAASEAARDASSSASTSQQHHHGSHPPVATRPDGTRKRRNSRHSEHSQDGAVQNTEPPQKRLQLGHMNDSTSYEAQYPSHRPGKADLVRYVANQDRESPDLNSSSRQPLHYQQDYHSQDGHVRSEQHYQSASAYPTRTYPDRPNAYQCRMTHPDPNQRAYIYGNSAPTSAVATSSQTAHGEMRRPPLPSHHSMTSNATAYQYHEPLLSPIPQSPMHPPSHPFDTSQYHQQAYRAESQSPNHSLEPPAPSPRQDQVSLPSIHQISSISSSTSPRGSIRLFRVPSSNSQDDSSMLRSPSDRSPSVQ